MIPSTDSFTASDIPPVPIRRFSVEEYHRLGELGVLCADDRVALPTENTATQPWRGPLIPWNSLSKAP